LPPRTTDVAVPVELVPAVLRLIAEARAGGGVEPVIDYATPPALRPRPWIHWPLALGLGSLAGVFTFLMVVVVPRFEEIYRDFGTKLPTPTVMMLRLSRFVANDYGWVVAWAIAIGVPVAVARLRPWPPVGRSRGWGVTIFVTILLTGTGMFAVYALLQLPMIALIQSVSGTGGR
jgi:hypothetical protein